MRHPDLLLRICYLLTVLLTLLPPQVRLLRCKCNTDRGPAQCIGDFCDIHSRDGKRAACGALRRARQTIFACVLIRRSSNDTYCHVVGSTTACWCRQMDFCNADLEAELFDVDEAVSDSESDSDEQQSGQISGPDSEQYIIEATLQQIPVEPHTKISPIKQTAFTSTTDATSITTAITAATTTVTTTAITEEPVISTSTKRSVKTKINPAIRMDVMEKMKLTPQQKEQPPTVVAETISDSYEDELDDDDDGFQWQAISIPENAMSTINTPFSQTESTNSQKLENNKSRTVEVVITDLSSVTTPVTSMTPSATVSTGTKEVDSKIVSTAEVTSTTPVRAGSTGRPISYHSPNRNPGSLGKSGSAGTDTGEFWSGLIHNLSPLRPVASPVSSTMISSTVVTTSTTTAGENHRTEAQPATVQEILQQQQQIPEAQANYARLKLNSTSPTFIYSHSAPKTLLDHWKQDEREKQQSGDLDWRSDDGTSQNDNGVSSSSSSSSRKLSSAFFTSSSRNSLLLAVLFVPISIVVNLFCTHFLLVEL